MSALGTCFVYYIHGVNTQLGNQPVLEDNVCRVRTHEGPVPQVPICHYVTESDPSLRNKHHTCIPRMCLEVGLTFIEEELGCISNDGRQSSMQFRTHSSQDRRETCKQTGSGVRCTCTLCVSSCLPVNHTEMRKTASVVLVT